MPIFHCVPETAKWLLEIGAAEQASGISEEILVLGHEYNGYYPIKWHRFINCENKATELWFLFGIKVEKKLTKQDCIRILNSINAERKCL